MIRKHTLLGAAGAGALVLSVVGPASAAGELSADVSYTCVTAAGNATPSAHYVVDAAPAALVAGQKVNLPTTATFTLDATTTALAVNAFGWAKFDGKITTPPTGTTVGQNLTIARTAMGTAGNPTVATATGSTIVRPTAAGTYTLKLGHLGAKDPAKGHVTLTGYNASDGALNSVQFPDGNPASAFEQCKNDATKTTLRDSLAAPATVAVTKDASKVAVAASYSKATKKTHAKATVKGKNYKLIGTGKVTFRLKKGTHTLATVKGVKLNSKGIAKTVISKTLKHGKYKVVVSYGGNVGLKSSTGSDTFSVS